MREVILGVFHSDYFYQMRDSNKWQPWPFWNLEEYSKKKKFKPSGNDFVDGIIKGVSGATKIHFLLDEIYLPLDTDKATCAELNGLIVNKMLKKVQFWLKGEKIETSKVLSLMKKVKEDKLTFGDIDFKTI